MFDNLKPAEPFAHNTGWFGHRQEDAFHEHHEKDPVWGGETASQQVDEELRALQGDGCPLLQGPHARNHDDVPFAAAGAPGECQETEDSREVLPEHHEPGLWRR